MVDPVPPQLLGQEALTLGAGNVDRAVEPPCLPSGEVDSRVAVDRRVDIAAVVVLLHVHPVGESPAGLLGLIKHEPCRSEDAVARIARVGDHRVGPQSGHGGGEVGVDPAMTIRALILAAAPQSRRQDESRRHASDAYPGRHAMSGQLMRRWKNHISLKLMPSVTVK